MRAHAPCGSKLPERRLRIETILVNRLNQREDLLVRDSRDVCEKRLLATGVCSQTQCRFNVAHLQTSCSIWHPVIQMVEMSKGMGLRKVLATGEYWLAWRTISSRISREASPCTSTLTRMA